MGGVIVDSESDRYQAIKLTRQELCCLLTQKSYGHCSAVNTDLAEFDQYMTFVKSLNYSTTQMTALNTVKIVAVISSNFTAVARSELEKYLIAAKNLTQNQVTAL